MIVFYSPNGIKSLHDNFPNFEQKEIVIGAFGASTAKAVKDAGLRLDVTAPTPHVQV
jgi:uroporphyrinogen-III synthase